MRVCLFTHDLTSVTLQNSRLQEYICDYVDGTMDAEIRDNFEAFMNNNQIVKSFVDAARKGKANLSLLKSVSYQKRQPRRVPSEKMSRSPLLSGIWKKLYVVLPYILAISI